MLQSCLVQHRTRNAPFDTWLLLRGVKPTGVLLVQRPLLPHLRPLLLPPLAGVRLLLPPPLLAAMALLQLQRPPPLAEQRPPLPPQPEAPLPLLPLPAAPR